MNKALEWCTSEENERKYTFYSVLSCVIPLAFAGTVAFIYWYWVF